MFEFITLCLAAFATANPLVERATDTSVVQLSNNTGNPMHLASGILYGIPDTPNQIPDHFYTDMGFNYARAGGAQVAAPGRGWIWGLTEYKVFYMSRKSDYNLLICVLESFQFGTVKLQDGSQI
jgi:hypothetical protein